MFGCRVGGSNLSFKPHEDLSRLSVIWTPDLASTAEDFELCARLNLTQNSVTCWKIMLL